MCTYRCCDLLSYRSWRFLDFWFNVFLLVSGLFNLGRLKFNRLDAGLSRGFNFGPNGCRHFVLIPTTLAWHLFRFIFALLEFLR
ncbi:hypothetical protein D7Y57_03800 [Stenotrophomonas maltophilia]|nr:hypothetical protein DF40_015440 [Stenotrophomonas maltophilia M30]MBA0455265.1 hypothetical protein [Stenotrophomonas maltophilia]